MWTRAVKYRVVVSGARITLYHWLPEKFAPLLRILLEPQGTLPKRVPLHREEAGFIVRGLRRLQTGVFARMLDNFSTVLPTNAHAHSAFRLISLRYRRVE